MKRLVIGVCLAIVAVLFSVYAIEGQGNTRLLYQQQFGDPLIGQEDQPMYPQQQQPGMLPPQQQLPQQFPIQQQGFGGSDNRASTLIYIPYFSQRGHREMLVCNRQ